MHKYILKEFLPPFLLALSLFTFILLIDKIFGLINLILTRGINPVIVAKLFAWSLPFLFSLTIPIGMLVGCIIAFGRLSQANEITALKAGGIQIGQPMIAVFILGVGLSILLTYFNYTLVPFSQHAFQSIYHKVIYQSPRIKFQERTFLEIENSRLFVTSVDNKNHLLKGIIIYEFPARAGFRSAQQSPDSPLIITAPEGKWQSVSATGLTLKLSNGTIYAADKSLAKTSALSFENYTINLNLTKENSRPAQRSVREMSGHQLRAEIKNLKNKRIPAHSLSVEYSLRGALAWACLCFTFLGMCVGTKSRRGTKSVGFGLGLILIFFYYLLLISGITLGEKGTVPASVSPWLGNLVILGIAGFLFSKISKY